MLAGLDSSTTYLIVKCIRNFVHMAQVRSSTRTKNSQQGQEYACPPLPELMCCCLQGTVLMALLQPAPEVYDLFDDIMLLCEGQAPSSDTPSQCTAPVLSRSTNPEEPPEKVNNCLESDNLAVRAGQIVYHGPKEQVMPFFNSLGFQLPERKGIADFLQEVTSEKEQKVSL